MSSLTLPAMNRRGFFIQRVHLMKAPCGTLIRGGSLLKLLLSPCPGVVDRSQNLFEFNAICLVPVNLLPTFRLLC